MEKISKDGEEDCDLNGPQVVTLSVSLNHKPKYKSIRANGTHGFIEAVYNILSEITN